MAGLDNIIGISADDYPSEVFFNFIYRFAHCLIDCIIFQEE